MSKKLLFPITITYNTLEISTVQTTNQNIFNVNINKLIIIIII